MKRLYITQDGRWQPLETLDLKIAKTTAHMLYKQGKRQFLAVASKLDDGTMDIIAVKAGGYLWSDDPRIREHG